MNTPQGHQTANLIKKTDINLLSDTGLAAKRAGIEQATIKVGLAMIFICVLIIVGTLSFWVYINKQTRSLKNQQLSLQQQNTVYTETIRLANIYNHRLLTIQQLTELASNFPAPSQVLEKNLQLSLSADGVLNKLVYLPGQVTAGLELDRLDSANQIIHTLQTDKNLAKLWSDLIITKFHRGPNQKYDLEFSSKLKNQTTGNNFAVQP
jgi:hypothetical protein